MTKKRLRIAYISSGSPRDPSAWSGTHYYMFRALAKHVGEVIYSPLPLCIKLCSSALNRAVQPLNIFNKTYIALDNHFISKLKGGFWAKKLSEGNFDLIFAPASSDIAYLNTKIPIVYLSDATIALLIDYYPQFSMALSISKKEADIIDRLAISKSSLLVFPSEWAANSSINHYGASRDKVKIIPFGANIEKVPPKRSIRRKKRQLCRLLFIGKDWSRKGGKIAFDTLLELERMGLQSELVVCGCSPPKGLSHRNMRVIPWAKSVEGLLSEADFLILPTRAECYGIVFCEASAYGVPIISTNTGGVPGAVRESENGYLLDISAGATVYAKTILRIWEDRRLYHSLQKKCRKAFDERLNWDSWGISMRCAIEEALAPVIKARAAVRPLAEKNNNGTTS